MPSHPFNQPGRQHSGTLGAALATVLLLLALAVSTAPGAAAHDQITSASPGAGERLAAAPENLVLTFSGSLMSLGTDVLVLDSQEKDWAGGEPSLGGEVLTQRLKAAMPDGEYSVRWRVVSSDGHPINGSYTFLVGDAEAATGSATDHAAASSPQGTVAATGPAAARTAPSTGHAGGLAETNLSGKVGPLGAVMAAIGAFGGVGAYIAFVLIQNRRRNAREKRETAADTST